MIRLTVERGGRRSWLATYFQFELKVVKLVTFYKDGLRGSRHKSWLIPENEVRRDGSVNSREPLVRGGTPRLNGTEGWTGGLTNEGQGIYCPIDSYWRIYDVFLFSMLRSWDSPYSFREAFWSREPGCVIARTSLSSLAVEMVGERFKALIGYAYILAAAVACVAETISLGASNRYDLTMCFAVE